MKKHVFGVDLGSATTSIAYWSAERARAIIVTGYSNFPPVLIGGVTKAQYCPTVVRKTESGELLYGWSGNRTGDDIRGLKQYMMADEPAKSSFARTCGRLNISPLTTGLGFIGAILDVVAKHLKAKDWERAKQAHDIHLHVTLPVFCFLDRAAEYQGRFTYFLSQCGVDTSKVEYIPEPRAALLHLAPELQLGVGKAAVCDIGGSTSDTFVAEVCKLPGDEGIMNFLQVDMTGANGGPEPLWNELRQLFSNDDQLLQQAQSHVAAMDEGLGDITDNTGKVIMSKEELAGAMDRCILKPVFTSVKVTQLKKLGVTTLVFTGGVSQHAYIRMQLKDKCDKYVKVLFPQEDSRLLLSVSLGAATLPPPYNCQAAFEEAEMGAIFRPCRGRSVQNPTPKVLKEARSKSFLVEGIRLPDNAGRLALTYKFPDDTTYAHCAYMPAKQVVQVACIAGKMKSDEVYFTLQMIDRGGNMLERELRMTWDGALVITDADHHEKDTTLMERVASLFIEQMATGNKRRVADMSASSTDENPPKRHQAVTAAFFLEQIRGPVRMTIPLRLDEEMNISIDCEATLNLMFTDSNQSDPTLLCQMGTREAGQFTMTLTHADGILKIDGSIVYSDVSLVLSLGQPKKYKEECLNKAKRLALLGKPFNLASRAKAGAPGETVPDRGVEEEFF